MNQVFRCVGQRILIPWQFVARDGTILLQSVVPPVDVGVVVVGAVEGIAACFVRAVVVVPRDEETPVLTIFPQLREFRNASEFADGIELAWVVFVELVVPPMHLAEVLVVEVVRYNIDVFIAWIPAL